MKTHQQQIDTLHWIMVHAISGSLAMVFYDMAAEELARVHNK